MGVLLICLMLLEDIHHYADALSKMRCIWVCFVLCK